MRVAVVEMKEPYIAGFLAFREVDFLLDRLKEVREKNPQHYPQVFPLCNETSNADTVCVHLHYNWPGDKSLTIYTSSYIISTEHTVHVSNCNQLHVH